LLVTRRLFLGRNREFFLVEGLLFLVFTRALLVTNVVV